MIKQSINNKTNDTSKVVPMTKLVPKDQLLLVVQRSVHYKVRWKWSNLPEGFEEFWVDTLVYQQCDDVRLLLRMLNRKTMIFQKSEYLWWKTQDVDLLSLDLLWASHDFDPLRLTRKRTWGLNLAPSAGGHSNAKQTRWVGFSAASNISHALSLW